MDLTIPGWAILTMGAIIIPWLLWLTKQGNDNAKDIAINTSTDKHVSDELKKLNDAIEKQSAETKGMFDKLEHKIDVFIQREFEFLKKNFLNE